MVERELPSRDWTPLDRRSKAEAGQRRFKWEGDRATPHVKDHNVSGVRAPERHDAVVQLLLKLNDLFLDLKVVFNGRGLVLGGHIADIPLRILELLDLVVETLTLWWNSNVCPPHNGGSTHVSHQASIHFYAADGQMSITASHRSMPLLRDFPHCPGMC